MDPNSPPLILASARIALQIAAMPSQLASQVSNRRKQTRRCDKSPSHRGQITKSQIELRPKLASQHTVCYFSFRPLDLLKTCKLRGNTTKHNPFPKRNVLARRVCCYLTRIFEPFAMQLHAMMVFAFCCKPNTTLRLFNEKEIIKIEGIAPRTQHDTPFMPSRKL